ncbi:hypothetical protein M422DRAFT_136577, partial [Sphaerobolus stellatus SS14]
HDTSTHNLNDHVAVCKAVKRKPEQDVIKEYVHGHSYSPGRFRYLLALWVSRRNRPFKIIHDAELQEIFKMLYLRVDIVSRTTVARDVGEMFTLTKENVKQYLMDVNGKIHIVVDGWTSPQVYSFLGITIQYVRDGHIEAFILEFIRLLEGHTGEYLAEMLAACLQDYGIAEK